RADVAARHRCHQRLRHPAHGPVHARVERRAVPGDRGPARHAPGDRPLLGRGRARDPAPDVRRHPDRGDPGRPTGGHVRPDLLRPRGRQEHLRHRAFLLLNTGTTPHLSENGLLTTVCYQLGDDDPVYALEGSVAVAGSLVQWLRDNLGIISEAAETEGLAGSVEDNGDCYLVPAFSGLLAPRWRPDARGALVGLTR